MASNQNFRILCLIVLAASCPSVVAGPDYHHGYVRETDAEHNQRMAWWRDAKFGMFIHWGIYSLPAGTWKGKTATFSEWIRNECQIPVPEYEALAGKFNPTDFNAVQIVDLAKQAGMRYLVITAKHHDGFCMWDSQYTGFDLAATPFKRDPLKELALECKKQGIRFGLYYSIMDWHHPAYLPKRKWEPCPAPLPDFNDYKIYMKKQLEELILKYQPSLLWFDGEWEKTWTASNGTELYEFLRELSPSIIINNRVSKGRHGMQGIYDPNAFAGDYGTPEQQIPAGRLSYDWESCLTINDHWAYAASDCNFRSSARLTRDLVDIVSKGGNLLLNIGPKGDGSLAQEIIEPLTGIGKWMKLNGESIYGTTAFHIPGFSTGSCTARGQRLYIHIFNWPCNQELVLPGFSQKPLSVRLLADPSAQIVYTYSRRKLTILLPLNAPDPVDSVLVLEFASIPQITPIRTGKLDRSRFFVVFSAGAL